MALKHWFRLPITICLTALLAGCGGSAAPAPSTAEPAAAPSSAPTAPRAAASAVASPSPSAAAAKPAATAEAAKAKTVYVGNTDGQGVFIRKTAVMADRLRAYPDGTALTLAGDDVDGDGQHWHHVTTPDGLEGYVPAMYTVDTPP
jgi:hypothetical protein